LSRKSASDAQSVRHNAHCVRRTRNRWLAAHGVRDLAGSPQFCSNRVKTLGCHRPRTPQATLLTRGKCLMPTPRWGLPDQVGGAKLNRTDPYGHSPTLRQHRRCTNASSHIRTTPENVSVPSSAQPASTPPRV
jgi:hypothetical protein